MLELEYQRKRKNACLVVTSLSLILACCVKIAIKMAYLDDPTNNSLYSRVFLVLFIEYLFELSFWCFDYLQFHMLSSISEFKNFNVHQNCLTVCQCKDAKLRVSDGKWKWPFMNCSNDPKYFYCLYYSLQRSIEIPMFTHQI